MILAVYGLTRRGGPANDLLRGCKYLGTDTVDGLLYDMREFPALGKTTALAQKVVVDLYETPEGEQGEDLVTALDKFEGYFPDHLDQSIFIREEAVTNESAATVQVYRYRFVGPKVIPSGDYLKVSS